MNAIVKTQADNVVDLVMSTKDTFGAVLVDKHINFDREAEFAIQIITSSDYLMKVALGSPQSVRDAVTNIAAIGISLNPAKKQAYLVPRKNRVCLDISYMGLMDLAMETGSIKWAQAGLVREHDNFILHGFDQAPQHHYNPFASHEARGRVGGVYVVVKTADGDYLTHTMTIEEVYATRDRSEAWKAYLQDKSKKNPWVTDEGEMIKKTCVKQAYKYWPKTDRLREALHVLNSNGDGVDDLAGPTEPTSGKPTVAMPESTEQAQQPPAHDEVTDVTPKGEAPPPPAREDSTPCTVGEIAYITKKLQAHKVSIAEARRVMSMPAGDTLEGLTKEHFRHLKLVYK